MLLMDMLEHATQPEFVYAPPNGGPNDLVIWDNRATPPTAVGASTCRSRASCGAPTTLDVDTKREGGGMSHQHRREDRDRGPGCPSTGSAPSICDVHPALAAAAEDLMPFLDAYWREIFMSRSIDRLELMSYPESTLPYRHKDGERVNCDCGIR